MADAYYLRPRFHPSAPTGRIKAPAALVFDHGTLHSFYLNDPVYPFGTSPVSWGHASADLAGDLDYPVHYHAESLTPGADYDINGAGLGTFSRDANGEAQFAFYGGGVQAEDGALHFTINRLNVGLLSFPCGGTFVRDENNPLISNEKFPELDGLAPHGVKDPMISWASPASANGGFKSRLLTVPAHTGGLPIIFGSDDRTEWHLLGQISLNLDEATLGGSPDIIPSEENWQFVSLFTARDLDTQETKDILIFSVEGLSPVIDEHGIQHYRNGFTSGYITGHLEGTEFTVDRGFTELDHGLNFYYPRTCAESVEDGVTESTFLVGLIAQEDHRVGKSTDGHTWRNSLSIPRRLLLKDGVLQQHLVFPYQMQDVHDSEPFGKRLLHFGELGSKPENFHIVDESGAKVVTFIYEPASGDSPATVEVINGDERRKAPAGEGVYHIIVDGTAVDASFADSETIMSIAAVPSHGYHWSHVEVEEL